MRHSEWEWKRVENEFLISLSLLLLLTHIHSLDIYLSSSSNHQKNGWSAIIDSSQWTTGKRRLFYYNHRSFIHMQATNQRMKWTDAWQINIYLSTDSLKLFFFPLDLYQLFLTEFTIIFLFTNNISIVYHKSEVKTCAMFVQLTDTKITTRCKLC